MNKIVTAKVRADGTVVEILKDGAERPFPKRPMRPMTDDEVMAAALADPDAQPLTDEQLVKMKRRYPPGKPKRQGQGQ
jgi:putative transcriptional regulator